MSKYILVINPGSTSTKLALFEAEGSSLRSLVETNVAVPVHVLEEKPFYLDQIQFRKSQIEDFVKEHGVSPSDILAIAARGGPTKPLKAGTYVITKAVYDDIMSGRVLSPHVSLAAPAIAYELGQEWGVPAYFTDPVSVDEFIDEARISGLPEIPRYSALHALNVRAVARKYAESQGKSLGDLTAIILHLGGGFSVVAMERGRIIDAINPNEEGPMQLERAGSLPITDFVDYIYENNFPDLKTLKRKIAGKGGLVAYFGTNDFREILKLAHESPEKALFLEAMYYQVGKYAAQMNSVLKGSAEVIIITGGIAHNNDAIEGIKRWTAWMNVPYAVYPGSFEMEALAMGAWRVITGQEQARDYEVG
ncbi:butyrate kinase [Coprothermobacteraceae bacterium]|nr:butyrate kinase [Coprothermobacteraceae bacterium]